MIPFSMQVYGEDGIRMFIERFTSLAEYAQFFDIDLDLVV